MNGFIETRIVKAIKSFLTKQVNELLLKTHYQMPAIEFSEYKGGSVVVPVIALASCERSEKERIVRLDAYSLSITFTLPETEESEFLCYAYSLAVCRVLRENPTLGGIVDRAVVIGKKYIQPKKPGCGENWEAVITLRVTVENTTGSGE